MSDFAVKYPGISTQIVDLSFLRRYNLSWNEIKENYKPLVKVFYKNELKAVKDSKKEEELIGEYSEDLRGLNGYEPPKSANLSGFGYAMGAVGCLISEKYCSAVVKYRTNNVPAQEKVEPPKTDQGPASNVSVKAPEKIEVKKAGKPEAKKVERIKVSIKPNIAFVGETKDTDIHLPKPVEGELQVTIPPQSGIKDINIEKIDSQNFRISINCEEAKPGVYKIKFISENKIVGEANFEVVSPQTGEEGGE